MLNDESAYGGTEREQLGQTWFDGGMEREQLGQTPVNLLPLSFYFPRQSTKEAHEVKHKLSLYFGSQGTPLGRLALFGLIET